MRTERRAASLWLPAWQGHAGPAAGELLEQLSAPVPPAVWLHFGFWDLRGRQGGWELHGWQHPLLACLRVLWQFLFSPRRKKSQGSFSLIFLKEICNFLTESAELVKRAFSIRELFGWKISQLALLIPLTLFCHSSYLCINVWPLNQISSQGFHSYYSQRPSCNSWSTTDLRFITETTLVPHVGQPGHIFQCSLPSQGGWKRLCAKPFSSACHQMPQPGQADHSFTLHQSSYHSPGASHHALLWYLLHSQAAPARAKTKASSWQFADRASCFLPKQAVAQPLTSQSDAWISGCEYSAALLPASPKHRAVRRTDPRAGFQHQSFTLMGKCCKLILQRAFCFLITQSSLLHLEPWYIMWINIAFVLCALVYLGTVTVLMYWARPLGNNCLSSERKIIVTYLVVRALMVIYDNHLWGPQHSVDFGTFTFPLFAPQLLFTAPPAPLQTTLLVTSSNPNAVHINLNVKCALQ